MGRTSDRPRSDGRRRQREQREQNDMVCVLVLPVDREVTTLRGQSAGGPVTAWKLLCLCAVMATTMGQKGH